LLILKHADGFFGVDQAAASRLEFDKRVEFGKHALVRGHGLKATQVVFVGVGPLGKFRYAQIRKFGRQCLKLAKIISRSIEVIAMPIHGPGYGLDENEAFLSLIGGLMDAISNGEFPDKLKTIEIVERNEQRADRLRHQLENTLAIAPALNTDHGAVKVLTPSEVVARQRISTSQFREGKFLDEKIQEELAQYGAASEKKIKMFVAMPFKDDYTDEFDIAITEAALFANIVCERLDKEAYVGDILTQVRDRIESYNGMLALLNESNPNVYLEIGFAWAKNKPTVLIAKKGQQLPFDIRGQKCIIYSNITELRNKLKTELKALNDRGALLGQKGSS
jgi:hypothetical protein